MFLWSSIYLIKERTAVFVALEKMPKILIENKRIELTGVAGKGALSFKRELFNHQSQESFVIFITSVPENIQKVFQRGRSTSADSLHSESSRCIEGWYLFLTLWPQCYFGSLLQIVQQLLDLFFFFLSGAGHNFITLFLYFRDKKKCAS